MQQSVGVLYQVQCIESCHVWMILNPFIIIFREERGVCCSASFVSSAPLLIETSHTTYSALSSFNGSRKQMIDTPFDQKYCCWSVVFVLFWPMREIGTNRSNPFIFSIVFQIEWHALPVFYKRILSTKGEQRGQTFRGATSECFRIVRNCFLKQCVSI